MKIKRTRLYLILSIVLICAGYLIAYSYNYTKALESQHQLIDTNPQWQAEDQLREKITEIELENLQLEEQLRVLQKQVSEKEAEVSKVEQSLAATFEELESYRLAAGLMEATGPGVIVTLEDRQYHAGGGDPNDYIVHEQDVRGVINELFAAGAEGISVNGQRVVQNTAIRCVGPTIIVNDVRSTAPFEISAIGDPDILYQALYLPGGYVDVLQSWGITVRMEKKEELNMPAYVGDL